LRTSVRGTFRVRRAELRGRKVRSNLLGPIGRGPLREELVVVSGSATTRLFQKGGLPAGSHVAGSVGSPRWRAGGG
jgi:hypothetical protein